jgi:hypothetical protein
MQNFETQPLMNSSQPIGQSSRVVYQPLHIVADPYDVTIDFRDTFDTNVTKVDAVSIHLDEQGSLVDGEKILQHDAVAYNLSKPAAKKTSRSIENQVIASNYFDKINNNNLTVPDRQMKSLLLHEMNKFQDQLANDKLNELVAVEKKKSKQDYNTSGYVIPEYKSVYESNNADESSYQINEYKSIYE